MSKTRYQLQESYESVIKKVWWDWQQYEKNWRLNQRFIFFINRQLELKISEIAEKDVDAARLLREVVDSVAPNRAFPADPANELNCETYYFDTPGIEPHSVCKEKSKSTDLESVDDWGIIMESILCYMVIIWFACNQRIYTSTC